MVTHPQYYSSDGCSFKSVVLDSLLDTGFYRMQHLIFTTHFITEAGSEKKHPAFWLRTNLNKLKASKKVATLKNKCASFSVNVKQATINTEIENLYASYKNSLLFNLAANCYDNLHQPHIPLPYDSKMIEIRKKDELIAIGFFDCGFKSIAGILNIYHPSFKKYSLGKLLMLLKINYALNENMDYYYTGYFSTSLSKFDYKIFPEAAAMEVYLPHEKYWVPYESITKEDLNAYAKKHFGL